jgi:hypothetical protein
VAAGKFGAGRATAIAATHEQLSSARMMTGNMPVVPTRSSLSASGRAAAPSTIHSGAAQHFFGTPSRSHAESFQQQTAHLQQAIQQSHFSPVWAGTRSVGSASGEARRAESHASGVASPGSSASSARQAADPSGATGAEHGETTAQTHGGEDSGEWKSFKPESGTSSADRSERGSGETTARGEGGSYWSRTAPSYSYARGASATGSRPQLNMRQPIVQPRSYAGYGGSHSAPSGASHASGGSHSGGGGAGHSGGGGGGGGGSHH